MLNVRFRGIEIGLSHFDACGASLGETSRLREFLSLCGLEIAALFALPGWKPARRVKTSLGLSSPRESDRILAVRLMRKALAVAQRLECRQVASELSGDMENPDASRKAFVRSVRELLPDLEDADTTIFFEAHPGDFIEDSFEAVRLLRLFDSERIRYNYCMAHTFSLGHTPKEIVRDAGGTLGYLHIADTLRPERIFFAPNFTPKVKPHLHMVPGEGDVDFEEAFRSLEETGFDGYLVMQPFSNFDDPVRAAKKAKSRVLRLLADLHSP